MRQGACFDLDRALTIGRAVRTGFYAVGLAVVAGAIWWGAVTGAIHFL